MNRAGSVGRIFFIRRGHFARRGDSVFGPFAFPVPAEIIECGERAQVHAVDVQRAVEVIDLVLQDSRVPSGRFDLLGLSAVIEAVHAYAIRAIDHRGESSDA